MRIRRIHFNNFGIIRNQTMEGIHPGLVVIAGPNRAGKTTFMLSLRHLGYGLPAKNIPAPLAGQHDYSADIELADNRRGNIHILGQSKPKVSAFEGHGQISLDDIFHSVDRFTYQQVFTISLDELRRIPEGISSKEEEHLQVVLLGGGWVDALRLAQFKREFNKKAQAIGGSRGAKNVGDFKVFSSRLRESAAQRDEANKHLELYYGKQTELQALESETIPGLESRLKRKRHRSQILDIVKDHYNNYEQMLLLEEKLKDDANRELLSSYPAEGLEQGRKLKEEYAGLVKEHEASLQKFLDAVNKEDPAPFLNKKEALLRYEKELSGWKEKTAGLGSSTEAHLAAEKDLKQKLENLNAEWADRLNILKKIAPDRINSEILQDDVEAYRDKSARLESVSLEIAQVEEKLKEEEPPKEPASGARGVNLKGLLLLTGLGAALVLLTALIHPLAAAGAGFFMGLVVVIYFLSQKAKEKELESARTAAEKERARLKEQLLELTAEADTLKDTLARLRKKLDQSAKSLELPEATLYSRLPHLYRDLLNLKGNYDRWIEEKGKLEARQEELQEIYREISWVADLLGWETAENGAEHLASERLFDAVEEAAGHLELAMALEKAANNRAALERKIEALIEDQALQSETPDQNKSKELSALLDSFIRRGETHKGLREEKKSYDDLKLNLQSSLNMENRKAVLAKDDPVEEVLPLFHKLFARHPSFKEIALEQEQIETAIESLKKEERAAIDRKVLLENEIEILSTDDNLQQALLKIIGAKDELEALAEEYARHRLAELLVEEMHRAFIEDTQGTVLQSAGEIFSELTSDDYRGIALPEVESGAATALSFKVVERQQAKPVASENLSRATKEQLFLAMRLSRIRSMKPLPVIFDDSLVNFDPAHSRQAARLIAALAQTHQVFVLTCHRNFIKQLQDAGTPPQYWGLEEGRILGPYPHPEDILALLDP